MIKVTFHYHINYLDFKDWCYSFAKDKKIDLAGLVCFFGDCSILIDVQFWNYCFLREIK